MLVLVGAIVCGYFAYILLYNQEENLLNDQYQSLSSQLQHSEFDAIDAQIQSMKLMEHLFKYPCPDVTNWPNCSIPMRTFDNMTYDLVPLTGTRAIEMTPLLTASQAIGFESYALNYYKSEGYPNLGTTKNGAKGIYAKSGGIPYHDLTVTPANSKYKILVPVFLIGELKSSTAAALYNLYSDSTRAASINHVLDCSYSTGGSCGAITDVIQLVQDGSIQTPAALLNYPIRALNQPNIIVGIISTVINWDTTLSNSIPDYVNGLIVVLDSSTHKYTYSISNGKTTYLGMGDLHDSKYSSYARTFIATPFDGAVIYTITTYPSDAFVNQYHSNLPMIACIIVVLIMFLTSMIFFIYDFFVNRQASEKEAIIATRRQFVNFISHEIRTPLNTISLGMKLLLSEMSNTVDTYHEKKAVKKHLNSESNDDSSPFLSSEVVSSNELLANNNVIKNGYEDEDAIIKDVEDYLNVVKNVEDSSYMAITILNDSLNYDKLIQGKLNLEIEAFDIWDVVRSSSRAFIIQARQKEVNYDFAFQLDSDEQFLPMLLDKEKIDSTQLTTDIESTSQDVSAPVMKTLVVSSPTHSTHANSMNERMVDKKENLNNKVFPTFLRRINNYTKTENTSSNSNNSDGGANSREPKLLAKPQQLLSTNDAPTVRRNSSFLLRRLSNKTNDSATANGRSGLTSTIQM